ncbi:hypothetical protein BpHYR1_029123 [Brachionus plicatilis]|uniref:Uncharacterized protein n=1 Tax=Brachionus plicatilis TaxID=10195 RepID=A0A3M7PPU1_BRAPC|nr:hypothetical protein BpHYR1_029123 [Brachionus plicatilis]
MYQKKKSVFCDKFGASHQDLFLGSLAPAPDDSTVIKAISFLLWFIMNEKNFCFQQKKFHIINC